MPGQDGSAEQREVLDLGVLGEDGPQTSPAPARGRRVSRRSLLLAGAGAAAAAGVAAVDLRGGPDRAVNPLPPTPAPSPSRGPSPPPSSAPPVADVTVTSIGYPVLGGTNGWDLFGLAENAAVRIEPATGTVTRTTLPAWNEAGVSVVPVRGALLLHRDDYGPGYAVPDGRGVTDLPDDLNGPGPMLPGPDPGHVWVAEFRSGETVFGLRSSDGPATSTWVRIPPFLAEPPQADGAGGLLFIGVGGVYRAGPGPAELVTSGQLAGVGPRGWVTLDCDAAARCGAAVHTRDGRVRPARVQLDLGTQADPSPVSPDGATLAYVTGTPANSLRVALLDLATGARRDVDVALLPSGTAMTTVVWSPDGRWLAVLTEEGTLRQVEVATAKVSPVAQGLPALTRLVVRASG